MRRELIGNLRTRAWSNQHIPGGRIRFVGNRQHNRRARARGVHVGPVATEGLDARRAARRQQRNLIAQLRRAAGDGSDQNSETGGRAIGGLHRHAEGLVASARLGLEVFETGEKAWARIPGHVFATAGQVIGLQCGHGNDLHGLESELAREIGESRGCALEDVLVISDEIHLVHGEHYVGDRQEARQDRVPTCLVHDAAARVDEQHGSIGIGASSHYTARVPFVVGRIGENELAPFGGQTAMHQSVALPLVEQRRENEQTLIIVRNRTTLHQTADQGGFAVPRRAAGQNEQPAV
jgi:hypothetical protein